MSRESNKEAKRERILEAGTRIFIDKGFQAGKMEEIAALAGIAKGTVYEYFDSKLALLQEVVRCSMEAYFKCFTPVDPEAMSVREQLYRVIDMHYAYVNDYAYLARSLFRDAPLHDPEMKQWFSRVDELRVGSVSAGIQTAIKRGELREVDPVLAARVVLAVLDAGWVRYAHDPTAPPPSADDIKAALELVLTGIEN